MSNSSCILNDFKVVGSSELKDSRSSGEKSHVTDECDKMKFVFNSFYYFLPKMSDVFFLISVFKFLDATHVAHVSSDKKESLLNLIGNFICLKHGSLRYHNFSCLCTLRTNMDFCGWIMDLSWLMSWVIIMVTLLRNMGFHRWIMDDVMNDFPWTHM